MDDRKDTDKEINKKGWKIQLIIRINVPRTKSPGMDEAEPNPGGGQSISS